jgi:hypothetical protein
MRLTLAAIAFALVCGCSAQTSSAQTPSASASAASPTAVASPSSPESPGGVPVGSPVPARVLAPATDPPVGALCTAPIQSTADGNAGPLLCRGGEVNVQAWQFYAEVSASVLGLGINPTAGQVQAAICDDFKHGHATRPEEANGYKLATAYYGWNFNIDATRVTCP